MNGYETYFHKSQNPNFARYYIDYGLLKDKIRQFYTRRRSLSKIFRERRGTKISSHEFYRLARDTTMTTTATNNGGGGGVRGGGIAAGAGDNRLPPNDMLTCNDNGSSSNYFLYNDDNEREFLINRKEAMLRLSFMERRELSTLLEEQWQIGSTFYTNQLLPQVHQLVDQSNFDAAATHLLETIAFACMNIITYRQLIIRYDAFCWTFNVLPHTLEFTPMAHQHGMFDLGGVEELEKHIVLGMQWQLEHDATNYNTNNTNKDGAGNGSTSNSAATTAAAGGESYNIWGIKTTTTPSSKVEEFTLQVQSFVFLLAQTDSSQDKTAVSRVVFNDKLLAFGMRLMQYLLVGLQSEGFISMRGRHFKKEIEIIGQLRRNNFSTQGDTFQQNLKEIKPENVFPLFLNLVSCFLFMMNSYIIEPSSAYYAEELGSSDAVAGLMIGAAPLFALFSCIGYSYWTNDNYKRPLLFAGTLQFIGNLLYANALSYRRVELCLIGRAVTGLGAPRVINRRYVADATPFSLRTVTSAAFAMATALGAASGPAMSILLDGMSDFEFSLPFLRPQYFNGMTGPGYFMAMNWIIFTTCILFFFTEPTRSGLAELKRREESDVMAENAKKKHLFDEMELAQLPGCKCATQLDSSSLDDILSRQDSLISAIDSPKNGSAANHKRTYCCSCFKHMTRPVVICMSLIYMKRIALECIVGSTSIITKNRFGWNIKTVGTLHLVNGIIVIPVSIFSGYLSTLYEDRYLAIWFLSITLFGMAFLLDISDYVNHGDSGTYNEGEPMAVGPRRYITGSLIAFSGIEACESYVASLMSKVVPSPLAEGTFNSGLLATLVATGGTATGDLFIFLMGLISIRNLLNLLITPGMIIVASSIAGILYNYDLLAV